MPQQSCFWVSSSPQAVSLCLYLAIKLALEKWRHWLEGAKYPFTEHTDHKNLKYLRTAKRLNSRQALWVLFFNRFHLTLSYCPGSKNCNADALSPQDDTNKEEEPPEFILPTSPRLALAQLDIKQEVMEAVKGTLAPSACPDGLLYMPENLRPKVLQ